jgi:hypothetical protein
MAGSENIPIGFDPIPHTNQAKWMTRQARQVALNKTLALYWVRQYVPDFIFR